ncbi:hypothetical protein GCM10011576_08390 [Micromonospora parathelypteridis]|nr:hypothetical protein GCM10011576_08390 [Micromonospora parathelypteridis]
MIAALGAGRWALGAALGAGCGRVAFGAVWGGQVGEWKRPADQEISRPTAAEQQQMARAAVTTARIIHADMRRAAPGGASVPEPASSFTPEV